MPTHDEAPLRGLLVWISEQLAANTDDTEIVAGIQARVAVPTEVFVVAWVGGYETPAYEVVATDTEAWAQAEEWWKDAKEGEDALDVLRIDLTTLTIERLERPDKEEDSQ